MTETTYDHIVEFSKLISKHLFVQGFVGGSAKKSDVLEWIRTIEGAFGFGLNLPPQPPKASRAGLAVRIILHLSTRQY